MSTNPHGHIADIKQLAGSTQWMALDEHGLMDADIQVAPCGDGVFMLESMMYRTFWQQHNEGCAFHSEMLSEMTDHAQSLIVRKMEKIK